MRLRREDGFGLIELLIAVFLLNIGILALMGVFSAGSVAARNAATTANGTAVADKVMEVYRGMYSCATYLYASSLTGLGGYSTQYYADANAYPGAGHFTAGVPGSLWVTDDPAWTPPSPIHHSSATCMPDPLPSPDPRYAVQTVPGPDGKNYLVFTYIVLVQPSGHNPTWTDTWVKQVTISVFDWRQTTKLIARETSIFDPHVAGDPAGAT
jgi:type II secretory pathway pseudopilin PulG